jgi:hypothetical protein
MADTTRTPDEDPIADATLGVADAWHDAPAGKEPTATPDDFARMRSGVAQLMDHRGGDGTDEGPEAA